VLLPIPGHFLNDLVAYSPLARIHEAGRQRTFGERINGFPKTFVWAHSVEGLSQQGIIAIFT